MCEVGTSLLGGSWFLVQAHVFSSFLPLNGSEYGISHQSVPSSLASDRYICVPTSFFPVFVHLFIVYSLVSKTRCHASRAGLGITVYTSLLTCMPPLPKCWDCSCSPPRLLYATPGIEHRVLCALSKHFASWATSSSSYFPLWMDLCTVLLALGEQSSTVLGWGSIICVPL